MERRGLGYDDLRGENPGLVLCSISGFGRQGGAAMAGYDFVAQAAGGLMSVTGDPDGEPTKVGVALVDVVAGLYATVGILAALRARERTGRGQRVDVNLLSSVLAALVNQSSAQVAAGVTPGRMGNAHPSIAPYEALRCADGSLAVAAGNDGQFAALCGALGAEALATDSRFATNPDRVAKRPELRAELEAKLAGAGVDQWVQTLAGAGVPCAPVNDIAEALALAEELGLAPVRDAGGTPTVADPIELSETPPAYERRPPGLGEHDGEIRGWLGG